MDRNRCSERPRPLAMSVKRDRLGVPFGYLDGETMLSVTRSEIAPRRGRGGGFTDTWVKADDRDKAVDLPKDAATK